MNFPVIGDIATISVVSLDVSSKLSTALELMMKHEHRYIVVKDGQDFRLLGVMDIIKKQGENNALDATLKEMQLLKIPKIDKHQNILDAFELLSDTHEHICVINSDKSLYGFVTQSDIIANIDPETLMENYKLQDFLKLGKKVKMVHQEIITKTALQDMASSSIDNIIIIDKLKPVGILTTKDVIGLIKNQKDLDLPISSYMISPVLTIKKEVSIKDALEFVKTKKIKRVVVVDNEGNLEGIIDQKELISLTYSRWALLMKEHQEELNEVNEFLQNKNKEYELLATTDSLTGLYNRYKLSELYLSSYKVMLQRDNKLSLILLDIDFFKKVNDTYGHNIGDIVLIQVAHALLKVLRNIDIVGRWGGEEFVVLLPSANLQNALVIAENIRAYIQEMLIDTVGSVTVSLGVSEIRQADSINEVIQRADEALYLAKNSGRNCVKSELDL